MERGQPKLTTFHLVRHAAHGLLGRVLTGRMAGVGLSAEGRGQAERLAGTLSERPVAAVFASPQLRAQETAGPIAERLGLAVTAAAGLDEIDFGEWSGRPFVELERDERWHVWNRSRSLAPCPGGETMLQAQARAVSCLRECGAVGGEVVLVSHQDVLKAMLAHLLGLSLDHLERFALDPASRSVVTYEADIARVLAVNLPP